MEGLSWKKVRQPKTAQRAPTMVTTEGITSAEQLLSAHDLGRCELVRGELIMMSPAGSEHGWIVMNVSAPLAMFVKEHALGRVFGAETAL